MKYAVGIIALALSLCTSASDALADDQVIYQANNYTVAYLEPRLCTLQTTTPLGTVINIARDERDPAGLHQDFFYLHDQFPVIPPRLVISVLLQYDDETTPTTYKVNGAKAAGGTATGFHLSAGDDLLQKWKRGKQVSFILGDTKQTLIETVPLAGSGLAIKALIACTATDYSPVPAPPPA